MDEPADSSLFTPLAPPLATESVPSEICGYPVDASLTSSQADEPDFLGRSFRATGPGGRMVVLKPVDPDCLVKGRLHPSIKERLSRVRELALGGIANLHGVERVSVTGSEEPPPAKAWLIWEYLPGRTLSELAADLSQPMQKIVLAAREMILGVEALHRQGIVHGALRGSNVIVSTTNAVRLTHISPLLYADPADDVWGVMTTLKELVESREENDGLFGRTIDEVQAWIDAAPEPGPSPELILRTLLSKLGGVIESRDQPAPIDNPNPDENQPGRRSIAMALIVLVLAAGGAAAIWWCVVQQASLN